MQRASPRLREQLAKPASYYTDIPLNIRTKKTAVKAGSGLGKAACTKSKQSLDTWADCDDDEPLPHKRIKTEDTHNLHDAMPQPSADALPAAPQALQGGASYGVPPAVEVDNAREEVEILARLEEIRLERRLRELRASRR